MRQSVRILRQVIDKLPSGPINVVDWKNMPPPKSRVMTKMEELIHHFIVVTEGLDAPPGEIYFGGRKSQGRTRLLHQQQRRRRAASAENPRALVLSTSAFCLNSCPAM